MNHCGTVLSFAVRDQQRAAGTLDRLLIARCATSLGGPETLVCHPATTTHASMTPEEQQRAGISAGLLRVSIGLEDPDDLIADFTQAIGEAD